MILTAAAQTTAQAAATAAGIEQWIFKLVDVAFIIYAVFLTFKLNKTDKAEEEHQKEHKTMNVQLLKHENDIAFEKHEIKNMQATEIARGCLETETQKTLIRIEIAIKALLSKADIDSDQFFR